MRRLPPEFRLLAACCRWPDDARRVEAIASAATGPLDWKRFARLAHRHRAVALAADGLRHLPQAPEQIRLDLLAGAREQASGALALAAECVRLQKRFDAAGIPLAVIKGVPLTLLAYGDLSLKQSRDIDLFIAPEHVEAGWRLMQEAGYDRAYGGADPTPEEMDLVFGFVKDLEFRHPTSGLIVELHFRLVHNPNVLPKLPADEQAITLGGATLRTLSNEAYYVYLCVHAATHAIGRLKWLADIAALVRVTGGRVADFHARAVALKSRRASLLMLLLSHHLLGLEVPPALLAEARSNLMVRLLAANAMAALADEDWRELSNSRLARQRLGHVFLQSGRAFWFEVGMLWASESDRRAWRLPPALHWLYYLIRIPTLGLRIVRRVVRRPR